MQHAWALMSHLSLRFANTWIPTTFNIPYIITTVRPVAKYVSLKIYGVLKLWIYKNACKTNLPRVVKCLGQAYAASYNQDSVQEMVLIIFDFLHKRWRCFFSHHRQTGNRRYSSGTIFLWMPKTAYRMRKFATAGTSILKFAWIFNNLISLYYANVQLKAEHDFWFQTLLHSCSTALGPIKSSALQYSAPQVLHKTARCRADDIKCYREIDGVPPLP